MRKALFVRCDIGNYIGDVAFIIEGDDAYRYDLPWTHTEKEIREYMDSIMDPKWAGYKTGTWKKVPIEEVLDVTEWNDVLAEVGMTKAQFDLAVSLMDDEIREKIHMELAPCTEEEFLEAYKAAHKKKYGEEFQMP